MSMHESVTHIRNSVFGNTSIAVELVDVSHGGIVRFNSLALANVSLTHGAVVSTTTNDYEVVGDVVYYASDDAQYDVPLELVPPGAQTKFGADFVIADATMSDCLYLLAKDGDVFPGCPVESVAGRHRLVRSWNPALETLDHLGVSTPVQGELLMSTLLIEPDDDWFVEVRNVRSRPSAYAPQHICTCIEAASQPRERTWSLELLHAQRVPVIGMHAAPQSEKKRTCCRRCVRAGVQPPVMASAHRAGPAATPGYSTSVADVLDGARQSVQSHHADSGAHRSSACNAPTHAAKPACVRQRFHGPDQSFIFDWLSLR